MNKAFFLAAVLSLAPLPASAGQGQLSQERASSSGDRFMDRDNARGGWDMLDRLSKGDLKDRVSRAAERIEEACGDDFEHFCGDVTPGGGRLASCVDAFSDQMSRRCRSALRHAVDRVQRAVAEAADDCLSAIDKQCGDAQDMKQCLKENNANLPQSCRTIVAAVQQDRELAEQTREQGKRADAQTGGQGDRQKTAEAKTDQSVDRLRGMPAYSSDDKNLGPVAQVERGADGKIRSVQIEAGRVLGLGEKTITIPGDKIEQLGDRIRVTMTSDQIRAMPQAKSERDGAGR